MSKMHYLQISKNRHRSPPPSTP